VRRPRLHLVGIFHTIHNDEHSHCAFTGKAKRFAPMMRAQGWEVIVYANEGSGEDITMLSSEEFEKFFSSRGEKEFFGDYATVGSEPYELFNKRLVEALRARVEPGDIICHPFGHAHECLTNIFPGNPHVETGIGYPTLMKNSFKIFESYAWMHYHQGRDGRNGINYEWVVPNYFDISEWEPSYVSGNYLAFLGRICEIKGMNTIKAIADHVDIPIVLCGQGDPEPWKHPNIKYRGPICGKERSEFLRNARAMLMPSLFVEPFAGAGVEGMLCGTPLIAVDYGAFTETVVEGVTGFRCRTLQDWVDGISKADGLSRQVIADRARDLYSMETCGKKYSRIFTDIANLQDRGWYTLRC